MSEKEQWHSPAPEECHKMGVVQLSVPCLQNSSPSTPINLNFFFKSTKGIICTVHLSSSEKS